MRVKEGKQKGSWKEKNERWRKIRERLPLLMFSLLKLYKRPVFLFTRNLKPENKRIVPPERLVFKPNFLPTSKDEVSSRRLQLSSAGNVIKQRFAVRGWMHVAGFAVAHLCVLK